VLKALLSEPPESECFDIALPFPFGQVRQLGAPLRGDAFATRCRA